MHVVLAIFLGIVAHAPPAEEIRRAAQRVFQDEDLQRELPEAQARHDARHGPSEGAERAAAPPSGAGEDGATGRRPRRPPSSSRPRGSAEPESDLRLGDSPVVRTLLWLGVGVVAALLVFQILKRVRSRAAPAPQEPARSAALGTAPSPALADDAQHLADAGQYAEAAHVLLLRTLEHLARLATHPLPVAWTSREILKQVSMPSDAAPALRTLIEVVECTRFGTDEAARTDWERCQAQFQVFLSAWPRGAA